MNECLWKSVPFNLITVEVEVEVVVVVWKKCKDNIATQIDQFYLNKAHHVEHCTMEIAKSTEKV